MATKPRAAAASTTTADEPITPTADETVFSSSTETPAETPAEEPTPDSEPIPEPEPVDPALDLVGKVVVFHEHDEWGNPRTRVGVFLGEHTWIPGKYEVAPLPRNANRAFDLADLSPLPTDGSALQDS